MDIEKAKRILKKVQALVENMDEQGSVSGLEQDLLKSYLRDLYEAVSTTGTSPATSRVAAKPTNDTLSSSAVVEPVDQVETSPTAPEAPVKKKEPIATVPKEETEPAPVTIAAPAEAEREPVPVATPVEELAEATSTQSSGADATTEPAYNDALLGLFEHRSSSEVADKLQSQPITAIQDEMGINERLLTINELFGGNPKAFEETVRHLNGLSEFADARAYLLSGPATEYVWENEDRATKARSFVQLVRRKYL